MGLLKSTSQQYYRGKDQIQRSSDEDYGSYQFTSLEDIINQFMIGYVGADRIISKASRTDVQFYAMRAMQELSFDTFKSTKSQEIELPPSLKMILPQDYVNYVKIAWVDDSGIERNIYPTNKTSNPTNPLQDANGDFALTAIGTFDQTPSIVLDDIYPNIKIGMRVKGPSIIGDWVVYTHTLNSAQTKSVILLKETVGTIGNFSDPYYTPALGPGSSGFTTTETLTFWDIGKLKNMLPKKEDSITLKGGADLGVKVYGNKLFVLSDSTMPDVKVGMEVSVGDAYVYKHGFATIVQIDTTNKIITLDKEAHTGAYVPPAASYSGVVGTTAFFHGLTDSSDTWSRYKATTSTQTNDDYEDDTYWHLDGQRYGIEPQHTQANGSFYIDNESGYIHFSSNVSGKTIVLHYISDSLGTDAEMKVHKFAEEAMYKWIAHSLVSTKAGIPEYVVQRMKREKFAATRQAKLRLSNIKIEEITQILRGKSKQIKH